MSKYDRTDSTSSLDSGYDSESGSVENLRSIGENQEVIAKTDRTIEILRKDLVGIEGYITQELIKLAAANSGVIDITKQDFLDLRKSFLESKPKEGFAVLSVPATIEGIEEKIAKVMSKTDTSDKELVEGLFGEFRKEIDQFKQQITEDLSSPEKVESLVSRRHIDQFMVNKFPFFALNEKKEVVPIYKNEKQEFINKLTPHIQKFPPELTRALSLSKTNQKSEIISKLNDGFVKDMVEIFAIDPQAKKTPILDHDKVNSENVKRFAENFNQAVNKLDRSSITAELEKLLEMEQRKKVTSELLRKTLVSVEKDQKFPTDQKIKLTKILSPILEGMDSKYLENNKDDLIKEIKEYVIGSRTFRSRVTGSVIVPTKKIEASSKRLSDKYNKWQQGAVVEHKLDQGSEKIKNVKVDTQLQQLIMSQKDASVIREDIGATSELKLASKQDSKPVELSDILIEIKQDVIPMIGSDGIKLPSDQPTIVIPEASTKVDPEYLQDPNPSTVICQSAVEYALKKRNAKITPKESKKISDVLVSKINKFDHEYLKQHEGFISNSLATAFVEQGKVSFWRRYLTINKEKLQHIVTTLEENIIKSCEEELIKKLFIHQIGNTTLVSRVTEFLEQNKKRNIEFQYDPKKITNRQLVRMSHINRELFDKIIFPKSKVSRSQGKAVTPNNTPNLASTGKSSLTP